MTRRALISITFLVVVIMTTSIASGCVKSVESITGSGKFTTWDFDHKDFRRIEAMSGFVVDINEADSYMVRVTFDNNLLQYLDIEKSGDTLRMGLKPHYNYIDCDHVASINLPDLRELKVSGSSKARIVGFKSSHGMRFELSGGSSIDIDNLEAGDIEFDISGASRAVGSMKVDDSNLKLSGGSNIELIGSASDVDIQASGGSKGILRDFTAANVEVNLSGGSEATINTNGRLDCNLSGSSKLNTIGDPKFGELKISNDSTINKE